MHTDQFSTGATGNMPTDQLSTDQLEICKHTSYQLLKLEKCQQSVINWPTGNMQTYQLSTGATEYMPTDQSLFFSSFHCSVGTIPAPIKHNKVIMIVGKLNGPNSQRRFVDKPRFMYVIIMTRFDAFFLQTWFVKNKRRFAETKGGLSTNLLCEFGPVSFRVPRLPWLWPEISPIKVVWTTVYYNSEYTNAILALALLTLSTELSSAYTNPFPFEEHTCVCTIRLHLSVQLKLKNVCCYF